MRLSFSNQTKFLQYIYEILRRDETNSFEELLASLGIEKINADEHVQGKKKGEAVIARLFEIRFPESAELIRTGKFCV